MRLKERELRTLFIAPSIEIADGLGGVRRGFSMDRNPVRCAMIPQSNPLESLESGLRSGEKYLMLLPKDGEIAPGDGVCESIDDEPAWLCTEVIPWSAHLAATLERRIWA